MGRSLVWRDQFRYKPSDLLFLIRQIFHYRRECGRLVDTDPANRRNSNGSPSVEFSQRIRGINVRREVLALNVAKNEKEK